MKDDPRNSAWQCSKGRHCPRLVDVHIRRCVHKERRKTTRKEKKQKPQGKRDPSRNGHPLTATKILPRAVNWLLLFRTKQPTGGSQ